MVWILKRMYHGLPWGSWWKEAWDNGRSCFKGTWTSLSCISGHSPRVPASVLKHVFLPHCPPEVFSAHVSSHVLQLKRSLLCPSNSTHLCEFSVGLWQMPQTQWLRTIVLIRAYSSTDKKSKVLWLCFLRSWRESQGRNDSVSQAGYHLQCPKKRMSKFILAAGLVEFSSTFEVTVNTSYWLSANCYSHLPNVLWALVTSLYSLSFSCSSLWFSFVSDCLAWIKPPKGV